MPFETTFKRLTLAMLLLCGALALACSGGDDESSESSPTGIDGAIDVERPRIIIAGALVAPPYTVAVDGAVVTINDTPAASFAAPPAPEPQPVDESATLDAFDLVELARLVYLDAGGGNAGITAVVAALGARADVGSVTATSESGVQEVLVTDAEGLTLSLIPEPPDSAVRAVTDQQREDAAREVATAIEDHLGHGGGLVVGGFGTTIMLPAGDVEELLAATDSAMALDESQRQIALLGLYDDQAIVDELIEHYEPREASARPGLAPDPPMHQLIGSRPGLDGAGLVDGQVAGQSAKTPASPKAWVFVTLYWADAQGFIDALQKESYEVRIYNFYDTAQPPGSAWAAFLATSRSGAAYFATHSSARGLSLQSFASIEDARRAYRALEAQRVAGDIYYWQEDDGTWWLGATTAGISRNWKSADTIVHSASCHSITIAGAFSAREFFGYAPTTTCAIATPDTNRLWMRLTGEDRDGALREASAAFGAGGFSGGFRHQDGSPGDGTVLSPSVVETGPLEPFIVGGEGFVVVRFDADMDTAARPSVVLTIEGCIQPIADGQWPVANALTLPVRATAVGEATVTVSALRARSELGRIALDGNQTPEGKNGVATNRDDYVFKVSCVALIDETATPTSQIEPPTSTPDVRMDGNLVVDVSGPVTEGFVRVKVLVFGGEHYPLVQFHVAGSDACDADHYHAGVAGSFEGSSTSDPNPTACGFGRVSEVEVIEVDVSQELVGLMPFPVQ